MDKDKGWIKLYRSIRSNWVWEDFEMTHYWLDILFMVNHKDGKVAIGKQLFVVKAGQKITSLRKLSTRWNVSKDKVKRILKMFEQDGMITVKMENNATVLTVANYWLYQVSDGKRRDSNKDTFEDTFEDTYKYSNEDTIEDSNKDTNATQTRMIKNVIKNVTNNNTKIQKTAPRDCFGNLIEE